MRLLRAQMDAKIVPEHDQLKAFAQRPAINIQQNYGRQDGQRPLNRGLNEEVKIDNQEAPAEESDTYRESQLVPGADPDDINAGGAYIFIKDEASAIMHKGKRKVRYVFVEGENQPQLPEAQFEMR